MHIAFLTSCLEPGKDGVGDYTRDLAAMCVRRGHSCVLIALNDRHASAPESGAQRARDVDLEVLRLPPSSAWAERLRAAEDMLARRPVDWLSVQFVPQGYHPRGFVQGLGNRLLPITSGRRVHLMFHELWSGMHRGARARERVIGWIQRRAVLVLVASLRPQAVHTTNGSYLQALLEQAVPARRLPLCGSIPFVPNADPEWLGWELIRSGVPERYARPRGTSWRFGLFGSIHPTWSPEPLFSHIAAAAEQARRSVVVTSIGRQGPGEALWQSLQSRYGGQFSFAALGERSRNQVSFFLQGVDFGIATTPWQLIGKSATAAAMLDHGLPTIVSRDDVQLDLAAPAQPVAEPLLYKMDAQLPQWLLSGPQRRPARDALADMADTFLADLQPTAS